MHSDIINLKTAEMLYIEQIHLARNIAMAAKKYAVIPGGVKDRWG